jgi:hypothetical protein
MKERKVIDDTYLHANSDYTEPSSVPQEVSQYLEFVKNLVFELEVQGGLAKGVHDDVQKTNMWAQGLMDDRINN